MTTEANWTDGSLWSRWDPHIHTPGTLLADQFKGDWNAYLAAIRDASPRVAALGITDYCVLSSYEEFLRRSRAFSGLEHIGLVFPNVEFRISIETEKKRGVNLHLLFSPSDEDHVGEIKRVLSMLSFEYRDRKYQCNLESLVALGRAFDPKQTDERGALQEGVKQFKLDHKQLKELRQSDSWMRDNCLVALCLNTSDGTAGLSKDHSFSALREELESLADVMFSSRSSDRDYWLGKGTAPREEIELNYGALKPCVHGSDAHSLDRVLSPVDDKRCWIRGELSFSGLRQILLEPEGRVFVGDQRPTGPIAGDTIRSLTITGAVWLANKTMTFNPGLVAIIGPKGSGKTALADMIASSAGCGVSDSASFLVKARELLSNETASIEWQDSTRSDPITLRLASTEPLAMPGVRYLSQKFVDRLCSLEGVSDELIDEIESVIFQSIPEEQRLEATTFAELRGKRLDHVQRIRRDTLVTVERLSRSIGVEDAKIVRLPIAKGEVDALDKKVTALEADAALLLPKGSEAVKQKLASVQAAISARTLKLQEAEVRKQKASDLKEEYAQFKHETEQSFRWLRERYAMCGLLAEEWTDLAPDFHASAANAIASAAKRIEQEITDIAAPKVFQEADLATWPLAKLREEESSVSKALGLEVGRAKQHQELSKKIADAKANKAKLAGEIRDLEGAVERRKLVLKERREAYAGVFDTLVREQKILEELYASLGKRLAVGLDDGKRLEFQVRRKIDLDDWVARGESLLDLRKTGEFQGKGTLMAVARNELLPAWRSGGAQAITEAMEAFLTKYASALVKQRKEETDLRTLGLWVFSAEHVTLHYRISYEGVDISHLSPGMRGVVLLLLYLVVDEWDSRPLIVDQPEENLDPFSINDQLVPYFRLASARRQVILVTHNANLVVNADAHQVIVASATRESGEGLPTIRYASGGLELSRIRKDVCRILEGGERAFLERERRYDLPRSRRAVDEPLDQKP